MKAFSRNEVSEIPLHYSREELLVTGFVRKIERVEHSRTVFHEKQGILLCFPTEKRLGLKCAIFSAKKERHSEAVCLGVPRSIDSISS